MFGSLEALKLLVSLDIICSALNYGLVEMFIEMIYGEKEDSAVCLPQNSTELLLAASSPKKLIALPSLLDDELLLCQKLIILSMKSMSKLLR